MFANILLAGLAIAGASTSVSAQLVLGASSVPAPGSTASPSGPSATPSSAQPTASASSAPAPPPSSPKAASPAPTSPPQYPSENYASYMPYNQMTNGGYMSLDCGYGYIKDSSGKCTMESWYSYSGNQNECYAQTTVIIKYDIFISAKTFNPS